MNNTSNFNLEKGLELIYILKKRPNIEIEYIKSIIAKGLDLNAQDEEGKTAIMITLQNFRLDICEYLITRICDLSLCDKNGKNLIDYIQALKSNSLFSDGFICCPDYKKNGEIIYIDKIENWINLMNNKIYIVTNKILANFFTIDENKHFGIIKPIISYNRFAEYMENNIILVKRFPRHVGTDFSNEKELIELDSELKTIYIKLIKIIKNQHDENFFTKIKLSINSIRGNNPNIFEFNYQNCMKIIEKYLMKKIDEVFESDF